MSKIYSKIVYFNEPPKGEEGSADSLSFRYEGGKSLIRLDNLRYKLVGGILMTEQYLFNDTSVSIVFPHLSRYNQKKLESAWNWIQNEALKSDYFGFGKVSREEVEENVKNLIRKLWSIAELN